MGNNGSTTMSPRLRAQAIFVAENKMFLKKVQKHESETKNVSVTMWRVHGKPGNIQGNNGSITSCPPQCFLVCRGDNGQGQRRPGNKTGSAIS